MRPRALTYVFSMPWRGVIGPESMSKPRQPRPSAPVATPKPSPPILSAAEIYRRRAQEAVK